MNRKLFRKLLAVIMIINTVVGQMGLFWTISDAKAYKSILSEEARKTQTDSKICTRTETGNQTEKKESKGRNYVPDEVIVKFKPSRISLQNADGEEKATTFAKNKGLDKKENVKKANISVMKIKDAKTVEETIAALSKDANVEYTQPNYTYRPSTIDTNDTYKDNLWGLDNANDTDIDAPEAWAINEGTQASAIVAVVDSGVAYNHPDLAANMWDGTNCKDENGGHLGGCNHGYDFEDGDATPLPTSSSHGTHIAGTIAAVKNNSKGIIGVAPQAKIMAVKTSLDTANIIRGINFAGQNGAKVINASWGTDASSCSDVYDHALYQSIQNFNGLFVTASGNAAKNHDGSTYFDAPSDYGHTTACWTGLGNIISVAATNSSDNLASFSDYGANFVDVSAPGASILSTIADSTSLSESFESLTPPNIPAGFTQTASAGTADWGTYNLGGTWGKVMFGDINHLPYAQTANSTITSPTYDLESSAATIDFWAQCDTEYSTTVWTDYMALEVSGDGSNFSELDLKGGEGKIDEPLLDYLNGDPYDASGSASYHFQEIRIPSQYATSNFKFRFRWVANGNADTGGGEGCMVDDIKITKYSDGSDEKYAYYSGTSMATPHVAGLAALIWGYKPLLTAAKVKDVILTTGDALPALAGKTITGKRINAFNALYSLTAPVLTQTAAVATPSENKTPSYSFNSSKAGTITYSGSCGSGDKTEASAGNNTVTFSLGAGSYSGCTVTVADSNGNSSTPLTIPDFTIEPSSEKSILSFNFAQGAGIIDEASHSITADLSSGTNLTALAPVITVSAGATISPASGTAQNFTNPVIYTVIAENSTIKTYTVTATVNSYEQDAALLAADKNALNESDILGTNISAENVTTALAVLPTAGQNGSTISWTSNSPETISNDGQTVTRPAYGFGNKTVIMTATLTKGLSVDTKEFVLTVPETPASTIATVTSSTYTVGNNTIINIPFGTSKSNFLAAITKGDVKQTWNSSAISDPVISGNTLMVTAEDGTTSVSYALTVLPNSAKDITLFKFESLNPQVTGTINGTSITANVPYGTNVTALAPTVVTSTGSLTSPESGTAQNFTTPQTYTVTAADGTIKTYTITVVVSPAPSSGGGGGGGSVPIITSVSATDKPLTVKPTQEGTLIQSLNGNNKLKLFIPKGSVKSTTTFSAKAGTLSEDAALKEGSSLFSGLIFDVSATDSSGNIVKSFNKDLTATLTVPDLSQNKSNLELYYFDEASKKWPALTGAAFGADTITFPINYLTTFDVLENKAAVLEQPAATEVSPAAATGNIVDGDIIQCKNSADPFAVYIVKEMDGKKYIRHIVSLEIFNHYKHLKWENLKQVDSLEGFSLSGWVRVNSGPNGTAGANDKIYEINGDQTRHWINMTAQQFLSHGGSENAVYDINEGELKLYAPGADVMSI